MTFTKEKGGFVLEAYGDGIIRIHNTKAKPGIDPATIVLFPAGDAIAYTSDMKPIIPAPREIQANGVFLNLLPGKEQGIYMRDTNDGSSLYMLGNGKGEVIEEHPKSFSQLLEAGNFQSPNLASAEPAQQNMSYKPTRSVGKTF